MKFSMIIPTTRRPVVIRGLAERPALPASFAVAEGNYRSLDISPDYDQLLGINGPLANVLGRDGLMSHELRLSEAFEAGRSWEVPVCLAHQLIAAGWTLVPEIGDADIVCWATGAVDLDLSIVPDQYFVPTKLATSLELLKGRAKGSEVAILIPKGADMNDLDADSRALLDQPDVASLTTSNVGKAVEFLLGIDGRQTQPASGEAPRKPAPVSRSPKKPRRREAGRSSGSQIGIGPASAAVLILLAAGGVGAVYYKDYLTDLVARMSARGLHGKPVEGRTGVAASKSGAKTGEKSVAGSGKAGAKTAPGASAKTGDGDGAGDGASGTDGTKPAEGGAGTTPEDEAEARKKLASMLVVEEHRAPPGGSCMQVIFGQQQAQTVALSATNGEFPASSLRQVCAITIRLKDAAAPYALQVDQRLLRFLVNPKSSQSPSQSRQLVRVSGVLRRDIPGPLQYNIGVKSLVSGRENLVVRFRHDLRR